MWNYFFGRRNFLFSTVIVVKNKMIICIKAYWYCVSACPVVKLAFPYFRLVQNITNSASIDTIRIPLNNPMATMIIGVIPLLITEVHLITTNLLNKGSYTATSLPQTVVPNSLSQRCRTEFPEIADMKIRNALAVSWLVRIPGNYLKLATGYDLLERFVTYIFLPTDPTFGPRTPSGYLVPTPVWNVYGNSQMVMYDLWHTWT